MNDEKLKRDARSWNENRRNSDGYPPKKKAARLVPMGSRRTERQSLRHAVGY